MYFDLEGVITDEVLQRFTVHVKVFYMRIRPRCEKWPMLDLGNRRSWSARLHALPHVHKHNIETLGHSDSSNSVTSSSATVT